MCSESDIDVTHQKFESIHDMVQKIHRKFNLVDLEKEVTAFEKFEPRNLGVPTEFIQTSKDGTCMFASIGLVLCGQTIAHKRIRNMICDYMVENKSEFKNLIYSKWKFENYISNKRRTKVWGEEAELVAAARLFNITLCLFTASDDHWNVFAPKQYTDSIGSVYIMFMDRHYWVITSVTEDVPEVDIDSTAYTTVMREQSGDVIARPGDQPPISEDVPAEKSTLDPVLTSEETIVIPEEPKDVTDIPEKQTIVAEIIHESGKSTAYTDSTAYTTVISEQSGDAIARPGD